jgi:CheY-like chemotaxis protein
MGDLLGVLIGIWAMLRFSPVTAERRWRKLRQKPELIIMDMMMPGMDGRESTRIFRATPATTDTPILAATAMFRPDDLQACIEAGCNDYIIKPFAFEELRSKITALV